ncbi:MAG TPA: FkbM family methyltransferase [Cyclobacteriaceae bacterium]|nr:FkbM family methyltransferase [Cyclobacteriaceae bacterium]
MAIKEFLYRQKQRLLMVTSNNVTLKNIAEINFSKKRIDVRRNGFLVHEIQFLVPGNFNFLFEPRAFDLFLSNARKLNGTYEVSGNKLIFCFNDLRVAITSRSELYIINEIFVDKCYQFLLPKNVSVHVVDIGMNVGLASLFFASLPYVDHVHGYEPFTPTFKQAQENINLNPEQARKIETYNFGLGEKEQSLMVPYNSDNKGINASLINSPRVTASHRERLWIKQASESLNVLFQRFPESRFIVKIDAEGAEYAIFNSLFKNRLSEQVIGVMVEWHFFGPRQLEKLLTENRFMLVSQSLNENGGLIYAFR